MTTQTFNTSAFSTSMAQRFVDDVLYNTGNYFVGYGYGIPWGSPDVPPTLYDNSQTELNARRNMILFKRLTDPQVVFGTIRYDWVNGTIYDHYDDSISPTNLSYSGATSLDTANFYVLTPQNNVYKCIENNYNAASTVMPTGTSSSLLYTSDGYVWKFMYTLAPYLVNSFLDSNNLPVIRSVQSNFYSGGSISAVTINNPGSGYTTASISINGDGSSATNSFLVQSLTISSAGSGYTSAPLITFEASQSTGTGNITASATTTINSAGQVSTVTLNVSGYGYTSLPTITVSAPVGSYILWNPGTLVLAGQVLFTGTNYYTVVSGGTTGQTAPSATSGSIVDGSATLSFSGIQASFTVNGSANPAKFTPNIVGGQITSVTINDSGIGYSYADLVVTGNGTGASLTAVLSTADLTTNQSTVELTAVKGSLSSILVVNGGSGYSNTNVIITGDGTGATATANIVNGSIESILLTNIGSGYTYATATVSGGTGVVLRVIIAPMNGHGWNAVDELKCTNLLVRSGIGSDQNKGFAPQISYREVGLFRNMNSYGSKNRFLNFNGSACFVATGTVNLSQFYAGLTITQGSNQYLIVSATTTGLLLQSLNNVHPTANTTYLNPSNNSFVPTSITNPDIDVFSGDLLQLSALAPFAPSQTQRVSFNGVMLF